MLLTCIPMEIMFFQLLPPALLATRKKKKKEEAPPEKDLEKGPIDGSENGELYNNGLLSSY